MTIPHDFDPARRADKAEEFFRQGYNCSQSVTLAFSDIIGLPEDTVKTVTCGFGGGMGRLREVCGAFSGCVFLAGVMAPSADPSDKDARKRNYALVQELAEEFRKENGGSIICRELLGLAEGCTDSPTPSPRNREYYQKRPCAEIVRTAAYMVAKKIVALATLDKSQKISV